MIVTVCGAYRNCGDHLIGNRARALLRAHVTDDITVIDRKTIGPEHYEMFNKAKAVLLTGGPAYQHSIYPNIYPIEREKVSARLIPYGLGWKAVVGKQIESFDFKPDALEFIRDIHKKCSVSSTRDPLTQSVLAHNGVENVLMTGCPAWYDLEHFEKSYSFSDEPKTLVLSMPAKMQPGVFDLMVWLTKRFPKARRIASFHHGLVPSNNKVGRTRAKDFLKFSASAMRRGWRVASLANSLEKMEELYGNADFHIGYRVHAHILCLSQRRASILINEDTRGAGQAKALGAPSLDMDKKGNISHIQDAVENHFSSRGTNVEKSVETMRQTYPVMREFLSSI